MQDVQPMNIYYRDSNKKLRCIYTEHSVSDLHSVSQAVLEDLYNNKEVYYKPLLILLKGGKK